jgi:hypothetical protein
MGASYQGSFKQLGGLRNSVQPAQQVDQPFFSFNFSADYNGTYPDYIASPSGTPTFMAAPNSSTSPNVVQLQRGASGDSISISGDLGFMANDFSVQFWVLIPSNGAQNGDNMINLGNRVRIRGTSSGNGYADFNFLVTGGDSTVDTQSLRLAVDKWNHITIAKATGVGINGEGVQKFNGTRIGVFQNGSGNPASQVSRFDGSIASRGGTTDDIVNISAGQFADSILIGGCNMYFAELQVFQKCLFNLYDPYQTNFIPPNWSIYN